jgi:hypothetical protein
MQLLTLTENCLHPILYGPSSLLLKRRLYRVKTPKKSFETFISEESTLKNLLSFKLSAWFGYTARSAPGFFYRNLTGKLLDFGDLFGILRPPKSWA